MLTLAQDLRFALRTLRRNPGFATAAALTLALGIGATTAIFSVVHGVLLKPLPYPEAERLVLVRGHHPKIGAEAASLPDFTDWRAQNRSFEGLTAISGGAYNLTGEGDPERLVGARVTAEFFDVMRLAPAQGRAFTSKEDRPGAEQVLVLSHGLWQRRFGGEPGILGRSVTLDGQPYTVVGIAGPELGFPSWAEFWTPLALDPATAGRRSNFLTVVGRLKPGFSIEQANADLSAIARSLEEAYPETNTSWGVQLTRLRDQIVGDVRVALWVLLGAVSFVLLIACVNVANLLLARGAAREREMAIRRAVGARRSRLVRQLLTEAVTLALVGGALGLALAAWGLELLRALGPGDLPRLEEVGLNAGVLAFAFVTSLLTALLFGIAPALQRTGPEVQGSLKEGGAGILGRRRAWLDRVFVGSEVALAFVLLVGAGLAIRSFENLRRVDPGFVAERILTFRVTLPSARYPERPQRADFQRRLVERIEALPDVRAVGVTSGLPLSGSENYLSFGVEGRPPVDRGDVQDAMPFVVGGDYFRAMGISLLRGRGFTPQDEPDAPRAVVINQTMARRYWPDEDPIGQRVSFAPGNAPWMTIVGIAGDVRHTSLQREPYPQMYLSQLQVPQRGLTFVIRTEAEPTALVSRLRAELAAVDPLLPVYGVDTMEQVVSRSVAQPRFNLALLGLFSGLALILAAVGIYGVVAHSTQRRVREIGIRIALGARPQEVCRLVIAQGMAPVLIGVGLGGVGALALTRVLRTILFEISPTDPLTLAVVPCVLAGVALLATYVPARRATSVDPMAALRYE